MLKIVSFFLILMTAVSVDFPEPNHCFEYIDDARNEPFYVSEEVVVDFGWGGIDARQLGGFMYSYECAKLEGGEEVNYEVTNAADDDGPEWKAPPHSFEPGEYVVSASITSYDTMEGEGYQCYIVIAAEDPTAVIEGGSSRVVAPNLAFKVDGSQSTNSNLKDDPHKGLTYLWTCTQLKTPPSFCKGDWTFNEKVVTIPGKLAVDEDEFVFTLTVSTEWDTHDNTSQTIYVLKNSVNLVIDCKKNCPPVATYSDVKSSTFLEGFCHQSCKLVNDNDLVWTIASKTKSSFTFNYKTSTRFGREGRKFLIKENVLKPGIYNISLQLKAGHQRSGYSNIIIEVPGPAEVKDCRVTPEKGESLKTRFTFKCVQVPPNDRNYYELVYKDTTDPSKTTSVIEGYYPNVFRQTFVLSSSKNKKLQAIITKTGHPTNVVPLKVEVISSLANKPTKEVIKIVTNVYNGKTPSQSVEQLARSTDIVERRKAMQIMTSLVEELVDTKIEEDPQFTNFIRTLKIRATKDLLSTSPSKVSTILKMGDTLTKLNNFQSPTTDPEIAKISTSVCDKITDKMLNVMKEKQNLLNMAEESKSVARFVSRCLKSHAKENLKILEPLKLNISKKIRPPPSEGQPVLVEDYPDYEDHGPDYYNNLRDLTIATGNTLNASSKMAKVMAFTTAIGEGIVKTEGKFDTTLVLKDLGKEIADSRMASDGVVLIPSQDFAGETHPFDVFLTIWKQDIMWWNPNHTRVATNIAIIQFWHSTCKKRIYDFQQPVEIFFTKRPDFVFTRNSEKNVFRISDKCGRISCNQILQFAVPKRRMLHVEFSNFTEKNSLKFITTYFKFPTMGDFHNGTINEFDTLNISFINREDYDVLVYIGILSVYNKTETSIHFNVHSKVTNCLRWNREAIQWELSCYPGDGGNSSVIHCKCYHFSAIAGYFENINFLEKTVLMPDLELQVVSTKVIFLTFVVTLCVFHVLVIFVLLPKKKICVYYLADNNTKHRFAYLVTVKTGLKLSASTSSNVTIRLHGENKSSEPHVLNYPDPRKSLLQNFGEDLFLLATESSLGELEEIELWFDSVGVNPTWHCREIYVYDMQQHQEWRFKIQVKFSVLKGFTYYAVEPFKQKETIIKRKFRIVEIPKFVAWEDCQSTFNPDHCMLVISGWFNNYFDNFFDNLRFLGDIL
ncbi:polycystic kidney disease 1-related protein-like isoform X2 [Tribolium madens]|uniref:polycystic kidney disease 1-related protein-like isoform X2 n=1 Tax=Tribolium madens TaxID=41895 RepID=UPI001CF738F0|nr:polycystic kidney disease 1-related protein-like isoform X2 [Tribolium madens]